MVLQTDLEAAAESHDDLPDAEEVYDQSTEIPLAEMFDEEFMSAYTRYDSFDEMVEASPSDASSAADLAKVPRGAWDEFVAETTSFDDETELVMAVRDHWVAKTLDLA